MEKREEWHVSFPNPFQPNIAFPIEISQNDWYLCEMRPWAEMS